MFLKKYKVFVVIGISILTLVICMAATGTLSYPYIMIDRQIQTLRDCTFGPTSFVTDDYGFSFKVPDGYCVLPARLFPRDGMVEIVPKGWYFVLNEYVRGSIANTSQATILFEPVTPDRNPSLIIQNLIRGKFLSANNVAGTTTAENLTFVLANGVKGTDDNLYSWAFAPRGDNKYFTAIITKNVSNQSVRQVIMQTMKTSQ